MKSEQEIAPTLIESEAGRIPAMSVILVCWNNCSYLENCLESLYSSRPQHLFEVIVVDNGSTDGSQRMVGEKFPEVRIIQNTTNVGLSRASNQGIAIARAPYLLLLNNDTLVNGRSLDAMISCLDTNPEVAAAGGRLINPDGSFQSGYAGFSTLWEEFLIATRLGDLFWKGFPSHGDCPDARPVGWLSSACLLLRRDALNQVGLLDEEYFIYGDEADLQYRLKKAGWLVYYLPSAETVHYGGRSMDRWRRRYMVYRGKLMFYSKNYRPLRTGALRMMFAALSIAKIAAWAVVTPFPRTRDRARKELRSNLDVVRICVMLASAS